MIRLVVMTDCSTSQAFAALAPARETITLLAEALMIALLEGVKDDIKTGAMPSKHLADYEALCRTERNRLGG